MAVTETTQPKDQPTEPVAAKTSVMIDPVTGKSIPMKDGKPCRVCTDFKTWSKLEKEKSKKAHVSDSKAAESTNTPVQDKSSASIAAAAKEATEEEWRKNNCPADVETLGNATWTLLHTMAAYYPDRPAPSQMDSMRTFINSFADNYPCWFCKEDFKKSMEKAPVQVGSRKKLSEWLCDRHNEVNAKLGKKQFDCSKVFERWLNGPPDGRCD
ncbi:augmenter of liver regeneration [Lichtheimia corymbifera JMRC:FSU:9682]|uniref:Sulfhydryl oxidase n=1 Tax=Lichtheimia corymbifera JMRC:FSU:9682 TaxID=1263082 RepID=A0A068RTU3_9FUNG|nr:augmenter of liver regeneration [Lichtheimia corymbifera JMRC:FSU:9682]